MKFSILSVLALAAAPSAVQSWSMVGPLLYSGDAMVGRPGSMLARQRALADRMIRQTDQLLQGGQGAQLSSSVSSSPRYDLVDDDTKFQLSIDVPGIKMDDIDISLEDDYLTVRGQRVAADDTSKFISKFSQTFSISPDVEVDKFSATLDNGVLVVMAPKDMKVLGEKVRKIPIMMGEESTTMAAGGGELVGSTSTTLSAAATSEENDTIDLDKEDELKKKDEDDVKVNVEVKKHVGADAKEKK